LVPSSNPSFRWTKPVSARLAPFEGELGKTNVSEGFEIGKDLKRPVRFCTFDKKM
jgi:hypothetical protein